MATATPTQTGLFEQTHWCCRCHREMKASLTRWLLAWSLCMDCAQLVPEYRESQEANRLSRENPLHPAAALVYGFFEWNPKETINDHD